MSKPILNLTRKYQREPELVKVVQRQLTVPRVEQYYLGVREGIKVDVLCRLIDRHGLKSSLVFCNMKRRVDEVVMKLGARGYLAQGLHGDMTQPQRTRAMDRFKRSISEILVATDVAARGIDVEDIEAVFNYDLPKDKEYYVHRIGRTARAGKKGHAFSFVVGREIGKLRDIEAYAATKIECMPVPSLTAVEKVKAIPSQTSEGQGRSRGQRGVLKIGIEGRGKNSGQRPGIMFQNRHTSRKRTNPRTENWSH